MQDKNEQMAIKIAGQVAQSGGRTFYVGGLVRDHLLGIENKDIDIEIHGVPADRLKEILSGLGEVTVMGASFGIFGLRHYEVDIAMPRMENATGRGHKDFEIVTDPFLGPEKAALRRDFTMNALMEDVLTGEILDFFGGRKDLAEGVIRHVNAETFVEDPLRVLRAAQFAARFGFRIADETIALSKTMDLSALSMERITGELEKALMKAERPSVFFEELRRMEQLHTWFPEMKDLIAVPQPPSHHPEGDVWNHTMLVLNEAAGLRSAAKEPRYFMYAALVHDFGKPVTTEVIDGKIHSYEHEKEGLPVVSKFISRLTSETALAKYVLNMTELHMKPNILAAQNSGRKSFMKLFDRSVCPEDLLLLAKADYLGRDLTCRDYPEENVLREMLAVYNDLMSRPYVQGRDLVAAGIAPGPLFKEALDYGHRLRLAGVPKEQALPQVLALIRRSAGS